MYSFAYLLASIGFSQLKDGLIKDREGRRNRHVLVGALWTLVTAVATTLLARLAQHEGWRPWAAAAGASLLLSVLAYLLVFRRQLWNRSPRPFGELDGRERSVFVLCAVASVGCTLRFAYLLVSHDLGLL